jgi:tagatose-6-phosphate ketose/aldose isomerase
MKGRAAIICGAGTSAYAASAVTAGWPNTVAIPTTDLLLCSEEEILRKVPDFATEGLLVSLARSGDSPESTGVVARVQRMFPEVKHLVITCNEQGSLARWESVEAIVLDPRTNDRSLVMTSSFSNLVLAGLALTNQTLLSQALPGIVEHVAASVDHLESVAQSLAAGQVDRYVVLTSSELAPLAREACLKVLEMTAGQITSMAETFLGLRHGPLSFLREDTLVLCVLSNDPQKRRYEEDLILELRQKGLGKLVIVGDSDIPAMAQNLPDYLRTPFEIVFPQLLAYHLSLAAGFDPDNPSPGGVITRVVQKFRLHQD